MEPCWPSKQALAQFAISLTDGSEVINPDKTPDRFSSEATSANLLKNSFPGLIVLPGSEADLRRAVLFAQQNRLRIIMRCSGGDYNGRSTGRGAMVIKTERLKDMSFDDYTNTITFAAGVNHGDIYEYLEPLGRVYNGAQSRTVCAAGCLAGGCHGPLSRQFGLGADSVVAIRFLLFNGTFVTTSRAVNPQLFNAYLGAGQNSIAIATSFTARTYEAPPQVLTLSGVFNLLNPTKPNKPFANLFTDYFMNLAWLDTIPRELAGYLTLQDDKVLINFVYSGNDVVGAWNALESLLGSPYVLDLTPLTNYTSMYDYTINTSPAASEVWTRKFIANALVPADQEAMDSLTELLIQYRPPVYMWFVYGGAVSEGTTGSVPPGIRDAVCEAVFLNLWSDPNDDEPNMDYVSQFLAPTYEYCPYSYGNEWTTWGNTFNPLPDWKTRFYKNYDQVLLTKKRYDPCNVFSSRFSVGSDLPLATCY